MRRLLLALVAPLLGLTIVLTPATAAAAPWDFFKGVGCGQATQSAVCQQGSKNVPISGSNGLLLRITNFIALIAGIAAVIIIIVGGLFYITSGGDAKNVASARDTILYALIGLVVIVVAKVLITFVISKL